MEDFFSGQKIIWKIECILHCVRFLGIWWMVYCSYKALWLEMARTSGVCDWFPLALFFHISKSRSESCPIISRLYFRNPWMTSVRKVPSLSERWRKLSLDSMKKTAWKVAASLRSCMHTPITNLTKRQTVTEFDLLMLASKLLKSLYQTKC